MYKLRGEELQPSIVKAGCSNIGEVSYFSSPCRAKLNTFNLSDIKIFINWT